MVFPVSVNCLLWFTWLLPHILGLWKPSACFCCFKGAPNQRHKFMIGGSCHKYNFCCDLKKIMTNMCLSQQNTTCLSQQNLNLLWQHNKMMFVVTKVLSWQKFRCNKHVTNVSFLSQQTHVCHDKHVFVVTKMILVAGPTNDTSWPQNINNAQILHAQASFDYHQY